jgi:hypothetical protein
MADKSLSFWRLGNWVRWMLCYNVWTRVERLQIQEKIVMLKDLNSICLDTNLISLASSFWDWYQWLQYSSWRCYRFWKWLLLEQSESSGLKSHDEPFCCSPSTALGPFWRPIGCLGRLEITQEHSNPSGALWLLCILDSLRYQGDAFLSFLCLRPSRKCLYPKGSYDLTTVFKGLSITFFWRLNKKSLVRQFESSIKIALL